MCVSVSICSVCECAVGRGGEGGGADSAILELASLLTSPSQTGR